MKKFLKVFCLVVLCLLLTLTFVACAQSGDVGNIQGGKTDTNTDDGNAGNQDTIEIPSIDISNLSGDGKAIMESINNLIEYEGLKFVGSLTTTTNINDSLYNDKKSVVDIEQLYLKRGVTGYAFSILTANQDKNPIEKNRVYYPNDATGMVYIHRATSGESGYENRVKFEYAQIDRMLELLGGESAVAETYLNKFVNILYDFSNMKTDKEFKDAFLSFVLQTVANKNNITVNANKTYTVKFDAEAFLAKLGINKSDIQPTFTGEIKDILVDFAIDADNTLSSLKITLEATSQVQGSIFDITKPQDFANATNKYELELNVAEKNNALKDEEMQPIGFNTIGYSKISFNLDEISNELATKFNELKDANQYTMTATAEVVGSGDSLAINGFESQSVSYEQITSFVKAPNTDVTTKTITKTLVSAVSVDGDEMSAETRKEEYRNNGFVYTNKEEAGASEFTIDTAAKESVDELIFEALDEVFAELNMSVEIRLQEGVNINSAFKVKEIENGYALSVDFSKFLELQVKVEEMEMVAPVDIQLTLNVLLDDQDRISSISMDDCVLENAISGNVLSSTVIKNFGITFDYENVDTVPSFVDDLDKFDEYFLNSDTAVIEVITNEDAVANENLELVVDKDIVKTDITVTIRDPKATLIGVEGTTYGAIEKADDTHYVIHDIVIPKGTNEIGILVKAKDKVTIGKNILTVTRDASDNVTSNVFVNGEAITFDSNFTYTINSYTKAEISIEALSEFNAKPVITVDEDIYPINNNYLLVPGVDNEIIITYTSESGLATQEYKIIVETDTNISVLGNLMLQDELLGDGYAMVEADGDTYTIDVYRQNIKEGSEPFIPGFQLACNNLVDERFVGVSSSGSNDDRLNDALNFNIYLDETMNNYKIYAMYNDTLKEYNLNVNLILVQPVKTAILGTDAMTGANTMDLITLEAGDDPAKIEQAGEYAYNPNGKINLAFLPTESELNAMKVKAEYFHVNRENDSLNPATTLDRGEQNYRMRLTSPNGYVFEYDFGLTSVSRPNLTIGGYNAKYISKQDAYVVDVLMNQNGEYNISTDSCWVKAQLDSKDKFEATESAQYNGTLTAALDKSTGTGSSLFNGSVIINLILADIKIEVNGVEYSANFAYNEDTNEYYYEIIVPSNAQQGLLKVKNTNAKRTGIFYDATKPENFIVKGDYIQLLKDTTVGYGLIEFNDNGNVVQYTAKVVIEKEAE